ncbi:O-methyltransferase [Sutcliffiella sp. NPDC057660]|uniref:O-methyltransferase n=1 Tax=Sutcliffiella sp. NPDC057660 TaxID=3346199 RepID=UPI0036C87EA4
MNLTWIKTDTDSWLYKNLFSKEVFLYNDKNTNAIEKISLSTQKMGKQKLWEGYNQQNASRLPNQVRTSKKFGNFYSWVTRQYKPEVIVEFGTAFGVSGMYWLSGIEQNEYGELLTFEPNQKWASIAAKNLSLIGRRFRLINGTFEENIEDVLNPLKRINIAFIDAIHTREFLIPQFELVMKKSKPGSILVFDDINFSEEMRSCWIEIANDKRVQTSVSIDKRIGIVEL